jgi:hypothetical protein
MLESCGKRAWLYDRIFENSKNIDIAFLGTSKTMVAVNDSMIEDGLLQRGNHLGVANLSFCRPGRTLHYALLKDLFRHHRPNAIIIEVNFKEHRFSHGDSPLVSDASDIIFTPLIFHQKYFEDIALFLETRLAYHRNHLLQIPNINLQPENNGDHFFRNTDITIDPIELESIKLDQIRRLSRLQSPNRFQKLAYYLECQFPKTYLKKISRLAKLHGTDLYFLYIPSFGRPTDAPLELEYYNSLGNVLIAPGNIFTNPAHWADGDHVNIIAANLLTDYLVNALGELAD